jgi:protein-L-isoaspartate(D-aspartate) O-methyltransferase
MLDDIALETRLTRAYLHKDHLDQRVLKAMRGVPREKFVPKHLKSSAYDNRALPISDGQTISQPFIVALMTDLLQPQPDHTVLEIGTGSGYQAAVLAKLVKHVYSLEIIAPLAETARQRLASLGYKNISVKHSDGYNGYLQHAPFDGIIVTAASPTVPEALLEQLKPGGRLVIPIGLPYMTQSLFVVEKDARGDIHSEEILPVAFVPLTRDTDAG